MEFKYANPLLSLVIGACICAPSLAEIPANYYDAADTSSAGALRNSLHAIIDDHKRFPYTSSETDTWDILETADQDPNNSQNVITIYRNASYAKEGGGNSFYNREHTWPKSYGFPDDGSSNYPYTDAHHLFIADSGYNSSRSNKPYADCSESCSEKVTETNNDRGGINSNWTDGSFSAGSWETWDARKGDVARALMYMAIRYEGGVHNETGITEPDLILTDDRNLIDSSNTGSNGSVAYMGLKSTLLQWHKIDPVDDFERRHTDTVFSFQGNRNPFVDHPEYVACVFESVCNGEVDLIAPNAPSGLAGTELAGKVALTWNANSEADLNGYNIYRSETAGGNYTKLNASVVRTNTFTDENVIALKSYFYVVTASDYSANESGHSNEITAAATEVVIVSSNAWINEFHYDNASSDVNEFIEIAGIAGTDLTGWSLELYNGNGGAIYNTTQLSGIISDQQNGFGALSFLISGIQNGGPDGFALINSAGEAVQFLSYEGAFSASGGTADGMQSIDIGVSETSSTVAGTSLQLIGNGANYAEFTWQASAAESKGNINSNQRFPLPNVAPQAAFTYSCENLNCQFDASSSIDEDGEITQYMWDFGDQSQGENMRTEHVFANEGSFTVTLIVTDNSGAQTSITHTFDVIVVEQSYFENNTVMAIEDKKRTVSKIDVEREAFTSTIDVKVDITHSYRGDLKIKLKSPEGHVYKLKSKDRHDDGQDVLETYTLDVSGNASGTWKLVIKDKAKKDEGQLNFWSIQF
ncbi:endonuclease [Pseudoalteromonas denitrificans]|uniref:Endonuclease I n=1 Tax=Pseudoalteromonas denitrificans DSM 6059 TaxID=1123010 RepID=A0A1I1P4I3_9GAMM|nr:endonuclease [Pseudoalteromonas denitrificans]SFD04566.1 Endonuclease I [Pseudoalteromonas denitrificans DSM 6059]